METTKGIHLAIIPDGNRRWAKSHNLSLWKGHEKAAENLREIKDWCRNNPRVSVLTVWGFSTENWKRDPAFVEKLMTMLEKYLSDERDWFKENNTRLLHSGRTDRLSPSLKKLIEEITEETKDFDAFTLHMALDYGGKDEIVRAVNRLGNKNTTEDSIRSYLDHPELPDIDCIIRTSGERRTSNFFLWQSTYAEWIFVDKHFPDFNTKDLETALKEYEMRTKRFGE